jgi:hypothetical protein
VDHARRRDGQLGGRGRDRVLHEAEGVGEDRFVQRDGLVDAQRRRRELQPALAVAELDGDGALDGLDPTELVDEVHVPRGTAELAVGRRLQTDVLLHADDVGDRGVLDATEVFVVDRAGLVVLTGLQQVLGPQQRTNVVGPKRWGGTRSHRCLLARSSAAAPIVPAADAW